MIVSLVGNTLNTYTFSVGSEFRDRLDLCLRYSLDVRGGDKVVGRAVGEPVVKTSSGCFKASIADGSLLLARDSCRRSSDSIPSDELGNIIDVYNSIVSAGKYGVCDEKK